MASSLLLLDLPANLGYKGAVVRLGPWASPVEDPFCLSPPDIEPYPTSDAVKEASQRSLKTSAFLFELLASVLPRELKLDRTLPVRFWDMFLSYYLTHVAGIVEDIRCRCECLSGMDLIYGAPLNTVPEPPQNFPEYMRQCLSRSALRIGLTDACARAYLPIAEAHAVMYREDPPSEASRKSRLSRFVHASLTLGLKALTRPPRTDVVLWDRYHLAWVDVIHLARIGLPLFMPNPRHCSIPYIQPDHGLRERIFRGLPVPYSSVLQQTFPVLALEGLHVSLQAGRQLTKDLTGRTRHLYTFGRAWIGPEPIRAAASLLAAEGTAVISIQHGGGLAAYDLSAPAYAEYRLSDRFISWGWKDSGYSFEKEDRIVPMPSLYLSRIAARQTARVVPSWQLLFLVFSEELYPKWLYTPIFPELAYDYFDRERVLLDGLKAEVPSAVKLYPHEFGWHQNDWIVRRYPKLKILRTGSFPRSARRARLCIVDYNSTGFLELLAMGRPFMATWSRRWFRGTPAFEQHLDALQQAGLFYDKPNELVDAYYAIKPRIEAWWEEPARRQAVSAMANEFARVSRNSMLEWQRFMKETSV